MVKKRNIIIEGANCTGKTTAINLLRKIFSEATFVEYHDFYHQHIMRQMNIKELFKKEQWSKINNDDRIKIEEYLSNRDKSAIEFIKISKYNSVIIERLILTHVVYGKLLMNVDLTDYLIEQEKELLTNDIELILITCDREQLRCTLEDKIKTREDRNYDRAQYHLRDIEVGLKKDELYKFYFDKLRFVKKELIVNKGTCLEEFSSDLITVVKNLGVSIS